MQGCSINETAYYFYKIGLVKIMFKSERLQKIRNIIFDRKQINVSTLSSLLGVSEVTIRSDLEQLEQEGFLSRLHGGAVLNEDITSQKEINSAISGDDIVYSKDQDDIGVLAAKLIHDNERIFLGSGTVCYYIAKALKDRKNLTILTNSLYVANILSDNIHINVLLTGGELQQGKYCGASNIMKKNVENLFLSKAFFSVAGADFDAGYTVANNTEVDIYNIISARSKEVIFAIEYTKFNQYDFIKLGNLDMAPIVISNSKIPDAYSEYYFTHNIKIITAVDLPSTIL